MLWHIRHTCPQCGAPVELEESSRLFQCPFCRVRLLLLAKGPFRYVIPPRNPDREGVVFVPYWRFKGTIFSCLPYFVSHKLMDATTVALKDSEYPFSLGIRPQTQMLAFAYTFPQARFLRAEVPMEEGVKGMVRRIEVLEKSSGQRCYHKTFVGEQKSIIYAPFYTDQGKIFDGVLERPLKDRAGSEEEGMTLEEPRTWNVSYLPSLCPACGWDLHGRLESVVFVCPHCDSAWHLAEDRLKRTKLVLTTGEREGICLPFWRFRAESEGLNLKSFGDLARMANLPKVVQPQWEDEALYLWTPAFKIRPDLFLRLAGQLTLAQIKCQPYAERPQELFAAGLSAAEAFQSLKIVLADLGAGKRNFFPKLAGSSIRVVDLDLAGVFFRREGNELVHSGLNMSLNGFALEYGRSL
ncbi:MAG: hypothetical protein ACLFNV_08035 [Desulfovibrionales bacterium]